MLQSLALQSSSPTKVLVLALDSATEQILRRLSMPHISVLNLEAFETEELKAIKKTRNLTEYYWTLSSQICYHCIFRLNWTEVTYLDADIYFFGDPEIIHTKKEGHTIITPHNYSPQYDQSHISGRYCVQFVRFTNTESSKKTLKWWSNRCKEWCYAKPEPGKFGDQKYLDQWPFLFQEIQECDLAGAGMAPWNSISYTIERKKKRINIFDKKSRKSQLIFYHFHGFRILEMEVDLCEYYYQISDAIQIELYNPYICHLNEIAQQLAQMNLQNSITKESSSEGPIKQKKRKKLNCHYRMPAPKPLKSIGVNHVSGQ